MTKASILIVEDDPIIRQDLAFCVEDLGYKVVGKFSNYEDAITGIKDSKPDLVLLDINLGEGKDGIDIGNKIHQTFKIPFIYITSYFDKNTVNRAKETYPSAYIIKPFEEKDLALNIDLAIHKKRVEPTPSSTSNKIFVKNNQDLVALQSDDIVYIEAFDNYSNVFTVDDKYLVSHTLKKIEEKLTPKGFVRIHKSYLVNFEKIDTISEGMVFLGQYRLPIGKAYRSQLQEFLVTL